MDNRRLWLGLAALAMFMCGAQARAGEVFPITAFRVEGNSLISQAEIDELLQPLLGVERGFGHIQQAVEALDLAYRRRGYASVQIQAPEQELTGGVVRVVVTEARLDEVSFAGETTYFSKENIRRGLPAMQDGKTPNVKEISRQIALSNENPAKQIEVILGLGKSQESVTAKVKVEEVNPLKVFVGLDNTGTASTGSSRLTLGIQNANLFDGDHVATFAYVTSPEKPDVVRVNSFSYRVPFYDYASSLDLIYSTSSVGGVSVATVAGPLTFSGKGEVYAAKWTRALPRDGETSSKLTVGLDYRVYENDCSLGAFGAAGCASGAADVVLKPVTLGYSSQTASPGQITDWSIELVGNIPGGSRGNNEAFVASRPSPAGSGGASAHYYLLRGSASHVTAFKTGWQLRAALNAQWSGMPLVTYEQFGMAGSRAVRGFLEREVARDIGATLNLEAYTPELGEYLGLSTASVRALAFLDAGGGRNNVLAGETQPQSSLSSTGVGLRYSFGRQVTAQLDVARVLQGNASQRSGDIRGHLSLLVSY